MQTGKPQVHPGKPVKAAATLAALTMAAVLVLSLSAHLSDERRAAAQARHLRDTIAKVAPARFDNDPVNEAKRLAGGDIVYPLYYRNSAQGRAIETTAADGYSGAIRLLIGIDANNAITAVYPLAHRETPGLGDRIEPGRGPWIRGFAGMHRGLPHEHWRLAGDGGRFDDLTGASITARAVLRQVQKATAEAAP